MSKLMEAAIRLYHKREKEQVDRFFDAFATGLSFENTNADKIWTFGCKRWKRKFSDREFEIRDSQ